MAGAFTEFLKPLNTVATMDQDKYVVIKLSNQSAWKLPLKVVADHLALNMVETGDILLSEAMKQVSQSSDLVVASWVRSMKWDECFDQAALICSGEKNLPISTHRDDLHIVVMTEAEIDRFLTANKV